MENTIRQTEPETPIVFPLEQNVSGEKQENQNSVLNDKGNTLIILGGIIFLIIIVGIYYFYTHKANQSLTPQSSINTQANNQVAPTNKPVSLNPNTGNLYSDIKVRLNQVIK